MPVDESRRNCRVRVENGTKRKTPGFRLQGITPEQYIKPKKISPLQ